LTDITEAEKVALVAKIQWDQKIMEKESEKKMAEIEGRISALHSAASLLMVVRIQTICSLVKPHTLIGKFQMILEGFHSWEKSCVKR